MLRKTAIKMNDIVFRYMENGKRNILNHLSIELYDGGITLIMGGSGSGKSTLAAVAAGLYPENGGYLESGQIELYGRPLSKLNQQERAALLTVMFQNPELQFCMDTLENEMRFCLENLCVNHDEIDRRITYVSEKLALDSLLKRKFESLSGGEKQKAALACLLLINSKMIILDEPFANIDRKSAGELVEVIKTIRDEGHSILVIDHRADIWIDIADEIIIMKKSGNEFVRGISKYNISDHKELFKEEGLFFPDKRKVVKGRIKTDKVVMSFKELSFNAEEDKRGLFGKRENNSELLLDKASADFPKGKMTAIIGRSGSGKTSSFLAALRMHQYKGRIEINGQDAKLYRRKELYKLIGMVFQNPANQFVSQNVTDELEISINNWDKFKSAEKLLEGFGLGKYKKYSPYMLSQGQQRRLAVLAMISCGQQLLLLDEPTYGQDASSTKAIMDKLEERIRDDGLSVIFTTHDLSLAAEYADKIYELKNKKFIEIDPMELYDEIGKN